MWLNNEPARIGQQTYHVERRAELRLSSTLQRTARVTT